MLCSLALDLSSRRHCLRHQLRVALATKQTLTPRQLTCDTYCVYSHRQMEATYGPAWRTPNTSYHGDSAFTWDEPMLRQALMQKLSVTAWGDMPYQQRLNRCSMRLTTVIAGES